MGCLGLGLTVNESFMLRRPHSRENNQLEEANDIMRADYVIMHNKMIFRYNAFWVIAALDVSINQ